MAAQADSDPCALDQVKTCNRCGQSLPLEVFSREKRGKFGVKSRCKACCSAATAEWVAANQGKAKESKRNWYHANREREVARAADRRRNHPELVAMSRAAWKLRNPEYSKRAYRENREKELERGRSRRARGDATAKDRQKRYRQSRKDDPAFLINRAVSNALYRSLTRGAKRGSGTFEILGYSSADLMAHLERQFAPGMSWSNYGRDGWHIDHRLPLAMFDFTSPDDPSFRVAWALTNLQPMWASDNHSKGGKRVLLV